MKAIKLTKTLKDLNPNFFKGKELGKIHPITIPKKLVRMKDVEGSLEPFIFMSYDKRTDLHLIDGIKDVIQPIYDSNIEKLDNIIEVDNTYIFQKIQLTSDELEKRIPNSVPKLYFKTYLLTNHNIKNSDVDLVIDSLTDDSLKEKIKLLWYEADIFEKDNPYIYSFAPQLNLTESDIKNIFKSYA